MWLKPISRVENCGLYYKPITNVNGNSRVVNQLETSRTDDVTVIIYDRHMFIAQASGVRVGVTYGELKLHFCK
jgi:hypothetical protein